MSATDEQRDEAGGPVPVRDLMKQMAPESEAEGEPRWDGIEQGFENEDGEWVVRAAGTGALGTGQRGIARVMAVHFYRRDDPETPVREALVPAGRFPDLRPEELGELYERATPIELER